MRSIRIAILMAMASLAYTPVFAQGEANHWIFGNFVAMSFKSGSPVLVPPSPALSTNEGSSVISDAAGNLLFYTSGTSVWGSNHQLLVNGTGLKGNSSSTQSALIVPLPCSECGKYLIFTTDNQDKLEPSSGLHVSVVERSGTSWQVSATQKNIQLQAQSTEKLTAVSDGAGGFWVMAHGFSPSTTTPGSTDFQAYRVTCGLDLSKWTPVVTKTGSEFKREASTAPAFGARAAQGAMKFSHDGKRLAITGKGAAPFVEVFDFNTATGVVSSTSFKFVLPATQNTASAYGLEFSPDNQKLFLSTTSTVGQPNLILRFDLAANLPSTPPPAQLSAISGAAGTFFTDYGALQLAPDGNIYVARWNSPWLGVISSPNTGGVFIPNGFSIGGNDSRLGLPAIVQGKFACTPPPPGCCDRMEVTSHDQDNLTLKYRTFKIYNLKSPASEICRVEVVVTDANGNPPPAGSWQGGDVFVNGTALAPATQFVWPYKRLPKAGDLVPRGAILGANTMQEALQFNIGIDFSQPFTANVKLVIHHCDGSTCTLTYAPWKL